MELLAARGGLEPPSRKREVEIPGARLQSSTPRPVPRRTVPPKPLGAILSRCYRDNMNIQLFLARGRRDENSGRTGRAARKHQQSPLQGKRTDSGILAEGQDVHQVCGRRINVSHHHRRHVPHLSYAQYCAQYQRRIHSPRRPSIIQHAT